MIIEDVKQLAGLMDHTVLDDEATEEQIRQFCQEAKEYGFAAVCVRPKWVPLAADMVYGSGVKVASVVSFPHGIDTTEKRVADANKLCLDGSDEIDMVADRDAIVMSDGDYMLEQLLAVLRVCRAMRPAVVLKLIIESASLTDEQKVFACFTAQQAGVDFLKTSTGLHPAGGATVEDVRLMRQSSLNCKIKAAGGIRTAQEAIAMIEAGAERIGTSCAVAIIEEYKAGTAE